MKKIFVSILTLIIVTLLLTSCNNTNKVDITVTTLQFDTYEDLTAFIKTLDTDKHQVLGEKSRQSKRQVFWELYLIEKDTNKTYETFEFLNYDKYAQFKEQIPVTQIRDYFQPSDYSGGPYYVIFINESTSTTPSTSTEHEHSWYEKDLDGELVKFCKECGKIEQNTTIESHSHTWDVKKVDGKIISFCTECGKIAEQ